jgi:hypothetical protein
MPAVPTAERPPTGLSAYWLGVWRHALKTMRAQGTWRWEQRPFLDEYVEALAAAREARAGFKWLDHLEQIESADEIDWVVLGRIAAGLPMQWDRHAKRAAALAEILVLTPRAQKAAGVGAASGGSEKANDPSAAAAAELEALGRQAHLHVVA